MRERYECRRALGPVAFQAGDRAETGGWIRLAEPRSLDAPLLAALTDAWRPALFSRLSSGQAPRGVPTVDLGIHFRNGPEALSLPADSWFLVRFRTRCAAQGFLEEDGEVWAPSGLLLAQSRQLAVVL